MNKLRERRGNGLIKVITGAGRAGKSYLMNEIFYRSLLEEGVPEEHIIRFAFDSDEDIDLLYDYFPSEATKIPLPNNQYQVNSRKFRAFIREHTEKKEGTGKLCTERVRG